VRIIGGLWKRTHLPVIAAEGLRPTPDRVRETLFNWIGHQWNQEWAGRAVLDLFAGTGALGMEAASRGAARVLLAELSAPAVRQLNDNCAKLKASQVQVQRADAFALAETLARQPGRWDLIFVDPPYQLDLLPRLLPVCERLLTPQGLLYAEHGDPLPFDAEGVSNEAWLSAWELVRHEKAGQVHAHLLRLRKNIS
jgi:16S rRNA (guanine(966)-N(2))-methyltransferase RsmD